jgi:hypothetical protein
MRGSDGRRREPGRFDAGLLAEMKRGGKQGPLVNPSPEVELIALGVTAKALEALAAQIHRETEGIAHSGRIVNRTRASKLLRASRGRLEAEQPEDIFHREEGPESPVVDSRHQSASGGVGVESASFFASSRRARGAR